MTRRDVLSLSLSLARSKRWRSQPDVDMNASIRPTDRPCVETDVIRMAKTNTRKKKKFDTCETCCDDMSKNKNDQPPHPVGDSPF